MSENLIFCNVVPKTQNIVNLAAFPLWLLYP